MTPTVPIGDPMDVLRMQAIEEIEAEYDLNDSIYAIQPTDLPVHTSNRWLPGFITGYAIATVITLAGCWLVLN